MDAQNDVSFIWIQSDVLLSHFRIPFFPNPVSREQPNEAVNSIVIDIQRLTQLISVFSVISTICL